MLKFKLLIAFMSGFLLLACTSVGFRGAGRTIVVPDEFASIQKAIASAHDGDKIFIRNGIYPGNIVVDKAVSLVGESPEGVIIVPDESSTQYGIVFDIKYSFPFETDLSHVSISSLQIRNFDVGIEVSYKKINSIENCIVAGSRDRILGSQASLWLQGTTATVSNCTLVGTLMSYKARLTVSKNIIAAGNVMSRGQDDWAVGLERTAIDNRESSDSSFENNVIWGEVRAEVAASNVFKNPGFDDPEQFSFLSPYSREGFGAKLAGIAPPLPPPDMQAPEIAFQSGIAVDDVNLTEKQNVVLRLTVSDDSPIRSITIAGEESLSGKEYSFQRAKYKKDIERTVLLHAGYNKVAIAAEDVLGNRRELTISFLYGADTVARSDWAGGTSQDASTTGFRNRIALVIGIQDYPKGLNPLRYTQNDASAVYELLKSKGYQVLPPLYSPTLRKMKEALLQLGKMAGEDDKIVIYISGHGSNKKSAFASSTGLILPSDVDITNLSMTSLTIEELRAFIRNLEAKSVVIILDMCFAGGGKSYGDAAKDANDNSITEALADTGKGKVLLASSGDMEESFESDELKHGVFTYFLLQAVKNNRKSIDAIYEYAFEAIQLSGKWHQRPRKVFLRSRHKINATSLS